MGTIVVINHITLDGVMQATSPPDEDPRDGFAHGGWAATGSDERVGAKVGEWINGRHAYLFGRRSYDIMLESWNRLGGPFEDALNGPPKYVASRNPDATLSWPNSTLLEGDVPTAVSGLEDAREDNLVIMGSGELIGSLIGAGLIDVFVLIIHPLVLGTGRRLFSHGPQAAVRLTDSVSTSKSVLITTYDSADGRAPRRER